MLDPAELAPLRWMLRVDWLEPVLPGRRKSRQKVESVMSEPRSEKRVAAMLSLVKPKLNKDSFDNVIQLLTCKNTLGFKAFDIKSAKCEPKPRKHLLLRNLIS